MSDDEFACAVRFRIGLPPIDDVSGRCTCRSRQSFQIDAWHGLSCISLKRRQVNQRHNNVVRIIASTVQRLGAFAHIEPSRLDNTRIRPDLELQIGARRILADVAIVHPCAPSHQQRAQRSLGTANHAERRKHRRYDNLARTRRGIFLPFVVETHGAIASSARALMRQIAAFAGQELPSQTRHVTLIRLMTEVSVAVQKGNAHAALDCIQDAEGVRIGLA